MFTKSPKIKSKKIKETLLLHFDLICWLQVVRVAAIISIGASSLEKKYQNMRNWLNASPLVLMELDFMFTAGQLKNPVPELTCLNFLQGNFLSSDESVIGFFLLFWNFFLLSCRLSDIPPLQSKKVCFYSFIQKKKVLTFDFTAQKTQAFTRLWHELWVPRRLEDSPGTALGGVCGTEGWRPHAP